jgi:GNAT superfamily N-acetyltransferase
MRAVVTRADLRVGSAAELGVPVEAVAAFYRTNWQRRIALGLPAFYRWQFVNAPESHGSDHCCVALDQDEIVGVMGLNPRSFVLAGAPRASAELTTWVVAAAARGRGVGRAILAWLMERYDVLFGPGITEAALPLYLDVGFHHVRHLPRFTRVYRADLGEPFVRATARGREVLRRSRPKPALRVAVEAIGVEDVAGLAQEHLRELNHYVRDAASLAWRYRDHPVFKYEFYRVGGAVVGQRHDEVDGVGIVHVMECFGEARALPDALSFIDS